MQKIQEYESKLSGALLSGIASIKGAVVYGVRDPKAIRQRGPTLCFNLGGIPPATVTTKLAARRIAVRDGHMYSPRLMKRLGLSPDSGAVRASLVHYNNHEEVGQFLTALEEIACD
jgi:selenocysteine lyase/cysteine desulfurase